MSLLDRARKFASATTRTALVIVPLAAAVSAQAAKFTISPDAELRICGPVFCDSGAVFQTGMGTPLPEVGGIQGVKLGGQASVSGPIQFMAFGSEWFRWEGFTTGSPPFDRITLPVSWEFSASSTDPLRITGYRTNVRLNDGFIERVVVFPTPVTEFTASFSDTITFTPESGDYRVNLFIETGGDLSDPEAGVSLTVSVPFNSIDIGPQAIPEPSSFALLAGGVFMLFAAARKRR